ncbi:hypothetical protein [Haloarcula amylovorans]|uniref:hypothetical protein n=1 Tax=Haloarcula amylovorans TaxID=2562280 RepID=UPI0010763C31|nr:hypothetical protein [Halomicroarcula amylolytica]
MKIPRLTRTDSGRETDESTSRPQETTLRRTVSLGVKGGLIGTAVMTLYRLPIFRSLPPTAEFWAKYVGSEDAEAYFWEGLLLHFLYGAVGGGIFGVGFNLFEFDGENDRIRAGLVTGTVYSALMSVFGARVLLPYLLDESLEHDENLVFHAGHVVYGLSLGTWLGSRNVFGEVYE